MLPDGIMEERIVSSYDSGTRTITVTSAFSIAPTQNAPWLLTTSVSPTTWRVVSLAEDSENGTYGVTALAYNSGKFDYVEQDVPLSAPIISVLGEPPASPTNLNYTENLYVDNNKVFVKDMTDLIFTSMSLGAEGTDIDGVCAHSCEVFIENVCTCQ